MSQAPPWRVLEERGVVRDRFVDLRDERVQTAAGALLDPYWVMHLKDWAVIFAITPDRDVVLVRQWRQAVKEWVLEPPGGVVDEGDPVEAALRELREETGYAAPAARYLGAMFTDPARNTNRLHVLLAEGAVVSGPPAREPSEAMTVERLPLAALRPGLFGCGLHMAAAAMVLGVQSTNASR